MMKEYTTPEMELIAFASEDVITDSVFVDPETPILEG